ncbi:MAG TPA: peptide chain release factor 2 [Acidimicrobiales bacterium]|nr:peptide chain release factor 2 [Acidimicrobiales bacterium]
MRDVTDDLAGLRKRLSEAEGYLDLDGLRQRLAALEPEVARPDLWDDPDRARKVTTEYGRLGDDVRLLEGLAARLEDVETLYGLLVEEADESVAAEVEAAVAQLTRDLDDVELRSLYSGDHDELDAVCEIHAGEGGTDAQDWAEMMLRMYMRWAERRGFGFELDEVSAGQEAGILSATFIIRGRYAYGLLQAERGVHRLYRISPFDSQARRQTSYAALDVVPFIEDVSSEVVIDDKDVRVDTYRSSGAGGQHVNVTDSAVRLTHLPTGVVVSCQNERSQLQNKAKAMQILAARLAERQRQEHKAELERLSGPQGQVSRAGSFIRGYVTAPYQKVKDERTGHETGNVQGALDGDLDEFMESYLRWRRRDGPAATS